METNFSASMVDSSFSFYKMLLILSVTLSCQGSSTSVLATKTEDIENPETKTESNQKQNLGSKIPFCEKCNKNVENRIFHSELTGKCISDFNAMKYLFFHVFEFLYLFSFFLDLCSTIAKNSETKIGVINIILFSIFAAVLLYFIVQLLISFVQLCKLITTKKEVTSTKRFLGLRYYQLSKESPAGNKPIENWINIFRNSEDYLNMTHFSEMKKQMNHA